MTDYRWVSELSDDDLFFRLIELNLTVGPVVASTRQLYEKKLIATLENGPPNGEPLHDEITTQYQEDVVRPPPRSRSPSPVRRHRTPSPLKHQPAETNETDWVDERVADVRRRYLREIKEDEYRNSLNDSYRYGVPSPRPAINNLDRLSYTSLAGSGYMGQDGRYQQGTLSGEMSSAVESCAESLFKKVLWRAFVLLILIIIVFMVSSGGSGGGNLVDHIDKNDLVQDDDIKIEY